MFRLRSFFIICLVFLLIAVLGGCTESGRVTETEIIPFATVKNDDPDMLEGQTKVVREGEQGLRTTIYEETFSWGSKVGRRKKIGTKTVSKPKDKVVRVGTKKAYILTVTLPTTTLEMNIASAARQPVYATGRTRINDALVIKGTIKNIGANPGRTGGPTDLAVVSPAVKGGLAFLPTAPVAALGPGQAVSTVWVGSINPGKPGANPAVAKIDQLNLTTRASVGPRNSIVGEVRSLAGLPLL